LKSRRNPVKKNKNQQKPIATYQDWAWKDSEHFYFSSRLRQVNVYAKEILIDECPDRPMQSKDDGAQKPKTWPVELVLVS